MAAVKINILLFAGLRERFHKEEISLFLPEGTPVRKVLSLLFRDGEEARRLERSLLFAVNETYAPPDVVLQEGDVLALIPPVAGG